MSRLRSLGVVAVAVGLLAGPALGQSVAEVNGRIDTVLGNHVLYERAIKALQQAVAARDKEDVAALVRYPITVSISGHKQTIRNAPAFIKSYDAIMTPDIVSAITGQKYEDLFVRDQGVMLGNGEAWINRVCLDKGCSHFVPKVVRLQHTGL
jgi:hypothetical protein